MRRLLALILVAVVMLPLTHGLAETSFEGLWQKHYYVDDFDEATNKWYVSTTASGTFSNTATKKSSLSAEVVINNAAISIFLYEYDKYPVVNTSKDPEIYDVKIKDGNDEIHYFTGTLESGGDRIFLTRDRDYSVSWSVDPQFEEILDIMSAGGKVRFSIKEQGSDIRSYTFSFDSLGFEEAYQRSSYVSESTFISNFGKTRESFYNKFRQSNSHMMLMYYPSSNYAVGNCRCFDLPNTTISMWFNSTDERFVRLNFLLEDGSNATYASMNEYLNGQYGEPNHSNETATVSDLPYTKGNYIDHNALVVGTGKTVYEWYDRYNQWFVTTESGDTILITLSMNCKGTQPKIKNDGYEDEVWVVFEYYPAELIAMAAEEEARAAEARVAEAERQKMLTEYTDKETVKKVQAALNETGFPCGTPDGAAGKKTKAALTDYQTAKGLTVTGTITHETLISMGLAE